MSRNSTKTPVSLKDKLEEIYRRAPDAGITVGDVADWCKREETMPHRSEFRMKTDKTKGFYVDIFKNGKLTTYVFTSVAESTQNPSYYKLSAKDARAVVKSFLELPFNDNVQVLCSDSFMTAKTSTAR